MSTLSLFFSLLWLSLASACHPQNQSFLIACAKGDLEKVRRLLESPAVNPAFGINLPLIKACENGHADVVRFLLYGDDASEAVEAREPAIKKRKLNRSVVDPTVRDFMPLSVAVRNGYHEVVRILLKDSRINLDFNTVSSLVLRPIQNGYVEMIHVLISIFQNRPAHELPGLVRLAAQFGMEGAVIYCPYLSAYTKVYLAVDTSNHALAERLIGDLQSSDDLFELLNIATRADDEIMVSILLEAPVEISFQDAVRATFGKRSYLEIILNSVRFDPALNDCKLLYKIAESNDIESLQLLMSFNGIDFTHGFNGIFWCAAQLGHWDIARLLLGKTHVNAYLLVQQTEPDLCPFPITDEMWTAVIHNCEQFRDNPIGPNQTDKHYIAGTRYRIHKAATLLKALKAMLTGLPYEEKVIDTRFEVLYGLADAKLIHLHGILQDKLALYALRPKLEDLGIQDLLPEIEKYL